MGIGNVAGTAVCLPDPNPHPAPEFITPRHQEGTVPMDFSPIPEILDGLPNISGHEAQVEAVTSNQAPVYLHETPLHLDRLQAVCAIALHMQQPLIPAGGDNLQTADTISNLDHMFRNPGV